MLSQISLLFTQNFIFRIVKGRANLIYPCNLSKARVQLNPDTIERGLGVKLKIASMPIILHDKSKHLKFALFNIYGCCSKSLVHKALGSTLNQQTSNGF